MNSFKKEKHEETIAYFESKALKNVDLVTKAANDKFINGDINYLEWVMLINQKKFKATTLKQLENSMKQF
jgi:hypothetical protein